MNRFAKYLQADTGEGLSIVPEAQAAPRPNRFAKYIAQPEEEPIEPPKKSLIRRAGEAVTEGVGTLAEGIENVKKRGMDYLLKVAGQPMDEEAQRVRESPIIPFSPSVTKLANRIKPKSTIGKGIAGGAEGLAEVAEGFTSPQMIGELGLATAFPPYALTFLPSLIHGTGQAAREATGAVLEKDPRQAAKAFVAGLTSAAIAKKLGEHGAKGFSKKVIETEVKPDLKTIEIQKPETEMGPTPALAPVQTTQPKPKLAVKKPAFDENEVSKVQTGLIQDVMKKGDITEDQLGTYLTDTEKDGALYRDITKKHLKGDLTRDEAVNQMHDAVVVKAEPLEKKTLEKRPTLLDRARESDPEFTDMDLRYAAKSIADDLSGIQRRGQNKAIARSGAKPLLRYYKTGEEVGPKGGQGIDYHADEIIKRAAEVKHLERTKVEDVTTGDLNLKKGDEVKSGGEWLKVTKATPEKITLKDGQKIDVDPVFDKLPIEGGVEFGVKRMAPEKTQLADVESKLYKEIEESVGETPAPIGLTVRKVGRQPGQPKDEGFTFKDPDIEARWKTSHGIKPEGFKARAKETLTNIWHRMSREYEYLPRTAEYSPLRFALHKLEKQREVSGDRTIRLLQGVTQFLNKNQYDAFERKVILDDLMQEAKTGHELPFGFTPDKLAEEHGRVSSISDANVAESLTKRKAVWDAIKTDYVKAMGDIGFDVSERVSKEDYFRHQVLEYAQAKSVIKSQQKLGTPAYRGFLKKREGSSFDINTDYLQAEHEVMAQMLYDIEVARTIKVLNAQYNIQPQLRKEAAKLREQGKEVDWHELIPEGYDVWQPREGSVFFMADSVPARFAEQLYSKAAEGINISEADVKKIMAIGGKRKEYVLKKEIVDTLNKLKNPDDYFEQLASKTLRGWKVWQLISPRRWIKYNLRNLTGDADGAFAGNPSTFLKTPQAIRDLYRMYTTDAPPSGDMKGYFERGGFGALLQAQEMGDINQLKMFERFLEARGTSRAVPLNVWQKYWKTARLSTDFREGILRYAAYLDYLEQMRKSPDGRPKNFGASIPEEVMALKNIEDRAFKMQNDLLGAYDEVSVFGQWLRKYIWPFWSWKEVNMKRYYRIFKNAANDNQLASTIGRKAAGVAVRSPLIAMRIGKFALKATALTTAVQTWNYMFFRKEEEQLPEGIRNKPHIIFGRSDKGEIIYFSRLGALSDLLEWFSIDDAPQDIADFLNGRRTLKEILTDMAKAPVNVTWSGLSPVIKQPSELAAGKSTYPDVFRPKTIRDRWRYLAQSVGLENEYDALRERPSRGYLKSMGNLLYYTIEPGQGAYSDVYDMKQRFLKREGKAGEGGFVSPRSNALYYAKLAVRYKDVEAFRKNLADYITLGGTREGLERSLEFLQPLSGLSKEDRVKFVNSLNEDDKIRVARAIKFYDKVINPVESRAWFLGQYGVIRQKLKQEGKIK